MKFYIIAIVFGLLSILSVHICSPIDLNIDSKDVNSTDKTTITESMATKPSTADTKPIMTTIAPKVETTGHPVGGEAQQRFARHQTDKPNDNSQKAANDAKPLTMDEPDVSDQNIHEVTVKSDEKSINKLVDKHKKVDQMMTSASTISANQEPITENSLIRRVFQYLKSKLMEIFLYFLSLGTDENSTESSDADTAPNRDE